MVLGELNVRGTKVALIVDNPFRDLAGQVLLAVELVQRGVTCYLVPMNLQREIFFLAPDFVLLPHLRKDNQDFVKQLIEAGVRVGLLDTEGGVLADWDSYDLALPPDGIRKHVQPCCVWGPRFFQEAVRRGWYSPQQMIVTGNPRFDFYSIEWRSVVVNRLRRVVDINADHIILINSNFTLANPVMKTPEKEIEVHTRLGYDPSNLRARQQLEKNAMIMLVELAQRIAEKFPNALVVYRPHPFERLQTYFEMFPKLPMNLRFVKSGTVDQWILAASVLIHKNCSTALEAAIAGIPAITPGWIDVGYDIPDLRSISIECDTTSEVIDAVRAILDNEYKIPRSTRERIEILAKQYFGAVDGRAYLRVADAILERVQALGKTVSLNQLRRSAYGIENRHVKITARIATYLKYYLHLGVHWSFRRMSEYTPKFIRWDSTDKRFGPDDVQSLVREIQLVLKPQRGTWQNVGVRLAEDGRDYITESYKLGRSVVLEPLRPR